MNARRFIQTAFLLLLDAATFAVLYMAFGMRIAIMVTVATKCIGIVLVLLQLPRFNRLRVTTKALNEKLRLRHENPDFVLDEKDMAGLRDVMFVEIYSHVAAFVLIPGPLSDVIGALLVFPPTANRILDKFMAMAWKAQKAKVLEVGAQ